MKKELFDDIMRSINAFSGLSRDCADMLIQKYSGVSANTLHSILSEAVIASVKASRKKLYGIRTRCVEKFKAAKPRGVPAGMIVRTAASNGLSPTLLARAVLEYFYKLGPGNAGKATLNSLMKDTTLIEDGDLAYEIYLCILHDDKYGYISDSFSNSVGYEYELKLKNYLTERNIAFCDEEQLRKRGYDKTPDCKLEVPIAVDGFVVNWIESKARFGSVTVHDATVTDQYLSYWNRFGPGLVIYWFDFIDTLQRPNEKRFMIMNHFPENITYMDTKLLRTES